MEKLILRGVMYGADKIPDSWFEKVPGGFYKQKERERQQHDKDEKRHSQSNRRDKSRRRRHSDEYEDRRRRYDEDADRGDRPGYATDRRRRHERSRSSYDGGDDYDSEVPERDRRRSRRRTYGDNDRYGYDDGHSRPNGARHSYAPEFPPSSGHRPSQFPDPYVNSASKRASAAAAAASAGTAAAIAQQTQRHATVASPPVVPVAAPIPGSVPISYVPYANIYGAGMADPQGAPQTFSPPPVVSMSPVQNNVVPGAPLANLYGPPPINATHNPRNFAEYDQPAQSRQRDSYVPSHSPSSDGGAAPPRRTRSERRPNREHEKSHGK
jgi:hypothetical protein